MKKSCNEPGSYQGECCCHCSSYIPVSKHPWNSGEANGSILETFGWVCTAFRDMDPKSKDPYQFSDSPHGCCELFSEAPTELTDVECGQQFLFDAKGGKEA